MADYIKTDLVRNLQSDQTTPDVKKQFMIDLGIYLMNCHFRYNVSLSVQISTVGVDKKNVLSMYPKPYAINAVHLLYSALRISQTAYLFGCNR